MPYDSPPVPFDFSKFDEAFKRERHRMLRHAAQDVLDYIFPNRVEQGQIYAVTGAGPFLAADLQGLFERAGFYQSEEVERLSELDFLEDFISEFYMVVGREGFDTGLLDWALEQLAAEPGSLIVLSQEDFLNDWLFGRYQPYTRNDPRVWEHPALKYLAEHSGPRWPWPSTEPEPSLGGEVDTNGWRTVHPLKARFGYTVGSIENLSDQERRRRLDKALTTSDNPLTLAQVVNHLAGQARLKKRITSRDYSEAIAKWERDLAYLKEKYYRNQFFWPATE